MPNRLRELRKSIDLSQEEVAERLGMSVSQVSRLERFDDGMTLARLREFAKLYGVEPQDILSETSPVSSVMVRGAVQAGVYVESIEWDRDDWRPVGVVVEPKYRSVPKFGLEVRGYSMDLIYPPGAALICVHCIHLTEPIPSGKRVIVERDDGHGMKEATCKEFVIDEDGAPWLWPRSSKPEFQTPIKADESARITALVIGSYRPE